MLDEHARGRLVTQTFIEEIKKILSSEQLHFNEPMSRHTTFRVGGPAKLLVTPRLSQIAEVILLCQREAVPYTIIGNGSNLLVSDKGLDGVVIELGRPMSSVTIKGCRITAEAGAMLAKVSNMAAEAGLTGMEFASGIPGTIGGAVVMNAGAYGGEMSQVIDRVTVLTQDGEIKELTLAELELSYRHSCITALNYIVLSAVMILHEGNMQEISDMMQELREQRIEKQPLEYPSAGSTFKRPEGFFAGKLIMDAGLRGFSVGDAQVSEKHCGFVVNRGTASAADVVNLMNHIQQEVERRFGVVLEPEVRKLGEFE